MFNWNKALNVSKYKREEEEYKDEPTKRKAEARPWCMVEVQGGMYQEWDEV